MGQRHEVKSGRRASYREGLGFGVVSFASVAVVGVVSGIAVARVYGIDVIGAYALAFAPVGIVGIFSTMQEQVALMRELATLPARAPRITGIFAAVLVFSFSLSLVISCAGAAIAHALYAGPIGRPDLFAPAAVLLAEYVVFSNSSWNLDIVFAAFRAGRELFWIRLLHAIAFVVIAVAVSFPLDSVWGLVLAQGGAAAISFTLRVILVRRFMRGVVPRSVLRDGLRTLPVIVRYGMKLTPGFIAEGAGQEAGTWILGVTASITTVGAWNRAWLLGRRLMEPTYRVGEVLFPTLVERRAHGDHRGFDRALVDTARYTVAGLLLPAALGGGAAVGVMELYGPGFEQAAGALAIILVVPALYCLATVQGQALLALDRPLLLTAMAMVRTGLIFGLGIALTVPLGLTGMALAQVCAYVVDIAWRIVVVRPTLVTPLSRLWSVRSTVAIAAAYAAGFATARIVDEVVDGAVGVLAALLAGALAFGAAFTLAGGLNGRDRERLAAARARFRGAQAPEPDRVGA